MKLRSFRKGSRALFFFFFLLLLLPQLALAVQGNLNLSATVPAKPTDLQSELSLTQPAAAVFPQETTLTYEINYGSSLPYTVNELTVEASWDLGTIDGSSNPSVNILDYAINTASNGYNGVQPIIDTTNRKITWKILNFPANTLDRKASFKLKTNSNYTGGSLVTFPIAVKVSGIGTSTRSEGTNTYRYKKTTTDSPTSTPTEAPNPTETPAPTVQATPTPIQKKPLQITAVDIPEIAEDTATITITTSRKTKVQLLYGTSPRSLESTVSDSNFARSHSLTLPTLTLDTSYYFTVIAVDRTGETVSSDTFTVTTAKASDVPIINTESIILKSDNLVLTNTATSQAEGKKDTTAIIPTQTGFDFQFRIDRYKDIKRVQAFVRNSLVLGINTFPPEAEASSETTELIEIAPGVYAGKLLTNATPGNYQIFIRIEDKSGNVSEEKVGDVRIVPRLTVLEKKSKIPVENARLLFSLYNERRHTYERISPIALSIENPAFTGSDGQAKTVLPPGRYLVRVTAIGYKTQEVKFTIGSQKGQEFPLVLLEKAPFNLLNTIKYYFTIFADIFSTTKEYVKTLSSSIRFIDFLSLITIFTLVYLTLVSFSIRTAVPIHRLMHHFFFHFLEKGSEKKNQDVLSGKLLDAQTDKPIPDVSLFLLDAQTGIVVSKTTTNRDGKFNLSRKSGQMYTLRCFKFGYHLFVKSIGEDETTVLISLSSHALIRFSFDYFFWYFKVLLGFLFEVLLIASFLFEVTVGYVLGWNLVMIYILCSIMNLVLWLHHLKHQEMHKV